MTELDAETTSWVRFYTSFFTEYALRNDLQQMQERTRWFSYGREQEREPRMVAAQHILENLHVYTLPIPRP
ncbi:hypothetical protein F1C16_08030 [Hymenobacter sp. NBH84]|uniref:Uncharacterized protein n=1 Tax=Hymenobacter defluvii TaxID=2054411 RepID=A0ABS3TAU1_9BACT|nr:MULTISPECIES: hypothetical protein [Hymenobacter]MBO3270772.1 hypothetical protein [Hymenobacter defluvii]QNE39504.1 hypothetical protein F1C16_08030 [Hymenobacter sp. NBH84]